MKIWSDIRRNHPRPSRARFSERSTTTESRSHRDREAAGRTYKYSAMVMANRMAVGVELFSRGKDDVGKQVCEMRLPGYSSSY